MIERSHNTNLTSFISESVNIRQYGIDGDFQGIRDDSHGGREGGGAQPSYNSLASSQDTSVAVGGGLNQVVEQDDDEVDDGVDVKVHAVGRECQAESSFPQKPIAQKK